MALSRVASKLPSFALRRSASRGRVQSPRIELEPLSPSINNYNSSNQAALGKRVMVVVDTSSEAKTALKWALSHGVQSQDTLVLLSVAKPEKRGGQCDQRGTKTYKLLCAMKNLCQAKKPEVQVELCRVEGKDEGLTIVEEAKSQEISLLVLGQKKRTIRRRLLRTLFGIRIRGGGVVEYCVQNATCMAIAVRRKGKRGGGYLITTKQRRDFWLLA